MTLSYCLYRSDGQSYNSHSYDTQHGSQDGSHGYSNYAHGSHSNGHATPVFRNESMAFCPKDVRTYTIDDNVQHYWCQRPVKDANGTILSGEYNEGTSQPCR